MKRKKQKKIIGFIAIVSVNLIILIILELGFRIFGVGVDPSLTYKMKVGDENYIYFNGLYVHKFYSPKGPNLPKPPYELFKEKQPPSLVSVVPARRIPHYNMVRQSPDGRVYVTDAQRGLDDWRYLDLNANINIYSREFLEQDYNHPVTFGTVAYEMPAWTFCDIDHRHEFVAAEAIFKEYVLEKGHEEKETTSAQAKEAQG